jgi:3-hydroxyisobutyrate dehydrogenase-like beta-hydroxyacid dehydrogenase
MAEAPRVAVLAAGAMGAAIAARLSHSGCTVITTLEGRSEATKARARDAGMEDVPFGALVNSSAYFLSVLPPSDALQLARDFVTARVAAGERASITTAYVDCNAVNPETSREIEGVLKGVSGVTYIDASIIGGPPSPPSAGKVYDPAIYASSAAEDFGFLQSFEKLGKERGLKVISMGKDAGVGAASALKMAYAV